MINRQPSGKQVAWRRSVIAKIRILPLVIAVATLSLAVKVDLAWTGIRGLPGNPLSVSEAQAKSHPPAGHPAGAGQSTGDAPEDRQHQAAAVGGQPSGPAEGHGSEPAPTEAPHGEFNEPAPGTGANRGHGEQPVFSANEVEVLQQLAERRQDLDERERRMEGMAALLQAAEARIEDKILELTDLKTVLEQLIRTYDDQESAKVASLVKIYETMKPKDAARIFEELEMQTLLLVAERMKERKLAPIMAEMNPQRAKEITVELARLRELPVAEFGGDGT